MAVTHWTHACHPRRGNNTTISAPCMARPHLTRNTSITPKPRPKPTIRSATLTLELSSWYRLPVVLGRHPLSQLLRHSQYQNLFGRGSREMRCMCSAPDSALPLDIYLSFVRRSATS